MIGDRLKQLRGDQTQENIAKWLGVSRARYSHYENGRNEPDIKTLLKLADLFNVTTDYLLGRSESPLYSKIDIAHDETTFLSPSTLSQFTNEIESASEEEQRDLWSIWQIIKSRHSNNSSENS